MKKIKSSTLLTIYILTICMNFTISCKENQFNQDNNIINAQLITSIAGLASALASYYATKNSQPSFPVHHIADQVDFFGKNFSWGVATSSTQNEESSGNNSWSKKYLENYAQYNFTPSSDACKSWSQWQDDIDKAAYLGVNAYRLSIEWSRVQPAADIFDMSAIRHYVEICKQLQAKKIAPMICLHHYSDPIWFLEQGGFSKAENINYFTTYCKKIYEALNPYVSKWIVISQPVAYALKGYSQGMQPPFIKDSNLADTVILNLFKAHINVYDMMHDTYKKTGQGLQPFIGICHQITQMKAYTSYSPLDHLAATFADRLYNKSLMRFFQTGHLRTLKPMIDVAYIPQAPQKFDFFALSYYSPKSFTGLTPIAPQAEKSHQTADLSRIIDKDGMYNAIVQAAELGKPIYVVESGIDPVDEEQRILLLNSYLSAIYQAIKNGYDVRGYYHWTLMDNYEWAKPYGTTHFGLYKNRVSNSNGDLDPHFKDHDFMLKDSGKYYKAVIDKHK